jgi:NADH-quinone oxidoreductase subunit M
MNGIYLVLGILLAGALLTFFANKIAGFLRDIFFLGTVLAATVLFFTNVTIGNTVAFNLGGIGLKWGITNFGYVFALIVLGLGVLGGIYSIPYMKGKERLGYFYMNFLLSLFAMMGILFSQDLVSFFFFWEIMTWSSYLMVIYNGNNVQKFGIKYFVFSAVGAYAMLMAIVITHSLTGTFYLSDLFDNFATFPHTQQILLPILLMTGFGVKAAMWPLHVWAPDAYSNAPMSYTQLFSGALSKMGVYGLIIVFVTMVSHLPENFWFREIIGWLGAITAVVGTLWALVQTDAKRLLAYSSVAQLGYIITGVAVGTELGMLAGIFLAVLHAMFKGTLFMAVGAVERQTGSTDMTVVTGLIRKMPWTFIATLISIIALAGIPPLGGFVCKWMLYESLITSNHYLMVVMIFFSSTAAFLYCYKILFGMFLGQEEPEFENVKEAPFFMVIPMLLLSVTQVFLGNFPRLLI